MSVPAIVHLMYFPWDREQRLKADPEDFDRAPAEALRTYAAGMEVKLWTYPAVRAMCAEHYPEVWEALREVSRPVMLVDVLRWVVVHRFGGLYWQMNTTPLVRMEAYLPAAGKAVRLFTEFDLKPEQCRRAMGEPIRAGEPEEAKRVMIQAFAAEPGAPFVAQVIRFLLERVRQYRPRKDYDILFITGNAAVSTAYDRFGRNDPGVELTDLAESRRLMKLHYQGAWRTDWTEPSPAGGARPAGPAAGRPSFRGRIFRDLYYRYAAVHPHETFFGARTAMEGERALGRLGPFIQARGIAKAVEVADAPVENAGPPAGLEVVSIHPSRAVVARRRATGADWRHVNLFYSALPRGDLFICPDYLERVPFGEAQRILARVAAAGFRYVALTDYPLLDRNWDAALGDFRPLNLGLAPFHFGAPAASVAWPAPAGRPDRRLAVWEAPLRR